jgi:hypothetical protein
MNADTGNHIPFCELQCVIQVRRGMPAGLKGNALQEESYIE